MEAPLCRCCGKPIPKKTIVHYFGKRASKNYGWWVDHTQFPGDKAEVQRLTNQRVIRMGKTRDGQIFKATVWDGESYVSRYFCKDQCARAFGYFALDHPGYETAAYAAAVAARRT